MYRCMFSRLWEPVGISSDCFYFLTEIRIEGTSTECEWRRRCWKSEEREVIKQLFGRTVKRIHLYQSCWASIIGLREVRVQAFKVSLLSMAFLNQIQLHKFRCHVPRELEFYQIRTTRGERGLIGYTRVSLKSWAVFEGKLANALLHGPIRPWSMVQSFQYKAFHHCHCGISIIMGEHALKYTYVCHCF